jgi:alkanesulfonate monooxygenase SsuD/methylene tetrahydromethanopterin reductase-like flavin-dependent oxidoreductase (luciferase family)
MSPVMAPHIAVAEEACEAQALVAELRASFARLWMAAQASGRRDLVAASRDLAPDIQSVARRARIIAGLAERVAS